MSDTDHMVDEHDPLDAQQALEAANQMMRELRAAFGEQQGTEEKEGAQ